MRRFLEREGLPLLVLGAWVASLAVRLPSFVVQDTWLALVDGRWVAHHWLPHHDTLTAWTRGRTWTDQQWGAHLVLWAVDRLGGIRLLLALGALVPAAMLALVWRAGRQLGGSARSVAFGLLLPILAAPWLLEVRTQTLALLPFVGVWWLLADDARAPRRRVLLVLPILVVWANLHGSASLGAGLVVLRGLWLLRPAATRLRGLALVVLAPLALLASPYGTALVGYYRLMLLHPPLARYVTEWQPVSADRTMAPFLVTAFGATALWAVARRAVAPFERWALPILLLAALLAVRNAIWFELALAISGPCLLDRAWPAAEPTAATLRLNRVLPPAAAAVAAALLVVELTRPATTLAAAWPGRAAAAVAAAAGAHGLVLADDVHADWLLWRQPSLAGRIAYDVRFELFGARQLRELFLLRGGSAAAWRACSGDTVVATFDGAAQAQPLRRERLLHGSRVVARTPSFLALRLSPGHAGQSDSACRTMPPST